ncbi:MAG: protein kinase [Candidatus Eremiobacteraeota bacterium]|nr:protein kinase [Candidatus Eremiobacteraeota bacterium]
MKTLEHPKVIDGYEVLGILGRGGMGWVYRARPAEGGDEVALKLLKVSTGETNLDRLRFEREYKLAATFRHPCLVAVYDYGVFDDCPYYTMEYVLGTNLREFINRDRDYISRPTWLKRLGKVFARLLNGLAYIHELSIIHRDLKPENILVDGQAMPRLLDFGLARHGTERGRPPQELQAEKLTDPGMVIGTVHYMAPEQVVGGELDLRTDLYSMGVMLYEIIGARLPFEGPDPVSVLGQILHTNPRPLEEVAGPLPTGLTELVHHLLAKEPSDRPLNCGEVLAAWRGIFGDETLASFEEESVARPPLAAPAPPEELYAPRFVGREAEMRKLVEALDEAGRVTVVTGSSGVGKTRLLQELAGVGRSRGMLIAQGAASELETLPYQLWVKPLRWALQKGLPAELEPFREALSILLPELGAERQPSAWEDPMRKYHLFEGMLRLLSAREGRVLLVLEDLQWAEPASLEFLHYFARGTADSSSVVLIVSLRDEGLERAQQLRSTLQSLERLRRVNTLKLEPLSREHTVEVIESMLGSGALDPDTVDLLYRETEGNPLFVGEILKTFVAEGRLSLDSGTWYLETAALPRTSAGGSRVPVTVRDAVRRRLEGLSGQDLDIVRTAAVIGYVFSFDVLAAATRVPELELLERLMQMVNRRILADDQEQGKLRFFNHPIVEVILETIPPHERRAFHASVAVALERQPVREAVVFELAHHFKLAGQPKEAAEHLLHSAEVAARTFAYDKARELYELASRLPEVAELMPLHNLYERLADVSHFAGLTEAALERYTWLYERSQEPLDKARLLRKLGVCWDNMGDVEQAHRCLVEALIELDYRPMYRNVLELPGFAARLLATRFAPAAKKYRQNQARSRETHAICDRLTRVLFFLRPKGWLFASVDVAVMQQVLANAVDAREVKAQAELYLGFLALHAPGGLARVAYNRLRNSIRLARTLDDCTYKANLIRDAGYLLFLAGYPEDALKFCYEGAELSQRLGDIHGLAMNHIQINGVLTHTGRLRQARHHGLKGAEMAETMGNRRDLGLAHTQLARAEALLGDFEAAERSLRIATKTEGDRHLPMFEMLKRLAEWSLAMGRQDYDEAFRVSDQAVATAHDGSELPIYTLQLRVARETARVEKCKPGEAQPDLRRLLEECHRFHHLALSVHRLQARQTMLAGDPDDARRQLQACLDQAKERNNPYEIAMLQSYLGQLGDAEQGRQAQANWKQLRTPLEPDQEFTIR